ncbi:hypothetical protein EDB85DRAFT_1985508 [Lactarius pseudohatsudake]|nr:hypothetical protein EDB85DRAFT_1985508 [Lactarius pseudohatsudake]
MPTTDATPTREPHATTHVAWCKPHDDDSHDDHRWHEDGGCERVLFRSTPPVPGLLRRYITHPVVWCHKLPPSLSFKDGALLEPLSVALAAVERANLQLERCGAHMWLGADSTTMARPRHDHDAITARVGRAKTTPMAVQ